MRSVHVLAHDRDRLAVLEPGVDDDLLARVLPDAGAVRPEDARLGHRRESLADPEVEMVERRGAKLDEDVLRARLGVGRVLVAEDVRAAVRVDSHRFHVTIRP